MVETSIGKPVQRKEDLRFITGKGRYTDDINLRGQAYGFFVRSPFVVCVRIVVLALRTDRWLLVGD